MTLQQMRDELRTQGAELLVKAEAATDERLKQNLIAKAETTGAYVRALSQYCKPEAKR